MKRILLMMCAWVLMLSAQAKYIVVDKPVCAATMASYRLKTMKVELSKKATIVHLKVLNSTWGWGDWSYANPRLVYDGDTLALKNGRLITHEGSKVINEEVFESGKVYEKNTQRDSLILTFAPLPKGAQTFDCLVEEGKWTLKIQGIRLDNQLYPPCLPQYKSFVDDGQPLKPVKFEPGELSATIKVHGEGFVSSYEVYTDAYSGEMKKCFERQNSISEFQRPSFLPETVDFSGSDFQLTLPCFNTMFPLILIPGEPLTLEIDQPAITYWDEYGEKEKIHHRDCYRLTGTTADINQVLLENQELRSVYFHTEKIPVCADGQSFSEWSEQLWQNLQSWYQEILNNHPEYTRRQRDFLRLMTEDLYVCHRHNYDNIVRVRMEGQNTDSLVAHLNETYTLKDPHIKDMILYQDGLTFYMPARTAHLPFLKANGLEHTDAYKTLKMLDDADQLVKRMDDLEVLSDSVIKTVHPLFQSGLRHRNDSIREYVAELKKKIAEGALERILPVPDVPNDKLIETIVAQHPGKAVFIDIWATWCVPCKKGIKAMEPMKMKLKDKDVVFVYLTNERSPQKDFERQVAFISGLHYRLPGTKFSEYFPGVDGIPQYYLYNREGKLVWQQCGWDDEELKTVEKEIKKAIKVE